MVTARNVGMFIDGVMGRLTSIVFTDEFYWWASLFLCCAPGDRLCPWHTRDEKDAGTNRKQETRANRGLGATVTPNNPTNHASQDGFTHQHMKQCMSATL